METEMHMVRDRKQAKKPYSAPSFQMLNATAAKAELEAKGEPKDKNVQHMLALMNDPSDSRLQPRFAADAPPAGGK
jgi:hypothetical protein